MVTFVLESGLMFRELPAQNHIPCLGISPKKPDPVERLNPVYLIYVNTPLVFFFYKFNVAKSYGLPMIYHELGFPPFCLFNNHCHINFVVIWSSKISLKLVTFNFLVFYMILTTSHKLHFAENAIKIRHLVPEIYE